jgi:hypothetical protein
VENSAASHTNKDSMPLSVLMFFTENFYLLFEKTNVSYQQHLDRQAGPSHQLPDKLTFVPLVLQMGRKMKHYMTTG